MQFKEKFTAVISHLGKNGEGIIQHPEFTIFVDGALPGEEIEATFIEKKPHWGRASLLQVLKPSLERIAPPCPFFGRCGGCQLMHLDYAGQLLFKQNLVQEAFGQDVVVEKCHPAPTPLAYRNKISLPVREGMKLGFFASRSNDLVEIDACLVHCQAGEEVFKEILSLIKDFPPLRHILIRTALSNRQSLVILVTRRADNLQNIAKEIMARCPTVRGVVHNINPSSGNTILGDKTTLLVGEDFIEEKLCNLTFRISANSFFQVNLVQAENLYKQAISIANLQKGDIVLDAYCGIGTLTLLLANHVKQVFGVESVPQAILDAKKNASINSIENVSFICDLAEKYIESAPKVEAIFLNPPRKGCDPAILKKLSQLKIRQVIYISCNPQTLARDVALLQSYGYILGPIYPFDMFPQTSHVECVTKLEIL